MHNIFDKPASPDLQDELKEAQAGEHHVSNLYDQSEDSSGEKVDLATGQPIDNTTMAGDNEERTIVSAKDLAGDVAAGDAADQWLRQNDPKYKG